MATPNRKCDERAANPVMATANVAALTAFPLLTARVLQPAEAHGVFVCTREEISYLERVRFFPRQMITAEDLTQEQEYFRQKLRRHNRLLHGWGIVCGAGVRWKKGCCEVIVEPGYILGPYGDEIVIDREETVDLCRDRAQPAAAGDPWCADDTRRECPDGLWYVVVRYAECLTRPVRVHTAGCGCDETTCEYSRIRDSYEFGVLSRLPGTYVPWPQPVTNARGYCSADCPPCPAEPWVVLAEVKITRGRRTVRVEVDDVKYRRQVVTFAGQYYPCTAQAAPTAVAVMAAVAGQPDALHEVAPVDEALAVAEAAAVEALPDDE